MAQYASKRWGVPVSGESIEDVDLAPETYDVIASWGVMTIIRDPRAVIAKFQKALKPGGVWAFNTYDSRSSVGAPVPGALVHPGPEHEPDPQRPHAPSPPGRGRLRPRARRRDRPHASLERLLFVLLSHLSTGVRDKFFERVHFLNRVIVPVAAPDAFEYICVKR